ncbi:putative secreted protein [Rhodopirellula maiorica SM1]|uniref:Putative secreted protein n=1 Tax=Rhodopirellula maiorica SM1 TaxID=1265738 RepID=M5RVN7_9BACT|nr:carboxypeptidase regulatory-like domain-containing protein [Rhodopirellula maiorica]EMI18024.1 putative secreted protein [Rhodopirellula maiorica SM1]
MRPHLQATAFIATACIVLVLATVGCGGSLEADYSSIGLVPVKGSITLDGAPIEGAVVFFEADDHTFSYGTTDESGYYELKFNSKTAGVTQGPKTVRISTVASTGERESEEEAEEDEGEPSNSNASAAKRGELFPETYNKKSELKVTVSDSQETFNFDLRGDGTTKSAT